MLPPGPKCLHGGQCVDQVGTILICDRYNMDLILISEWLSGHNTLGIISDWSGGRVPVRVRGRVLGGPVPVQWRQPGLRRHGRDLRGRQHQADMGAVFDDVLIGDYSTCQRQHLPPCM